MSRLTVQLQWTTSVGDGSSDDVLTVDKYIPCSNRRLGNKKLKMFGHVYRMNVTDERLAKTVMPGTVGDNRSRERPARRRWSVNNVMTARDIGKEEMEMNH